MSETTTSMGAAGHRDGRRRRTTIVVAGIGLLVLGLAATVTWSVLRTAESAESAVRDYVALLELGDAEAARQVVDPETWGQGREGFAAALVSDGVLRSSVEEFAVLDVETDEGADAPVGATAVVGVEYAVGEERGRAALRVERQADGPFGATRWRVVDPLVVPIVVESNVPGAGPATIGGEPVALSGSSVAGAEQLAALVYPGEYQLVPPDRRAFSAPTEYVLALGDTAEPAAEGAFEPTARVQLWFDPSAELVDTVSAALDEHVGTCLETPTAMPADCPALLAYLGRSVTGLSVRTAPEIDYLGSQQAEHVDGASVGSAVGMRSTIGVVEYTGQDGARHDESFRVVADIAVEGDTVDIVFRSAG